jgi:hypothetical protein
MQRDKPWEVAAPPLNPEVIFTLVFALNTTQSDAGVHDSIAEHQQTSKTRRMDFLAVRLLFSIYYSSTPMSQCHISPIHSRQRVPRSHISCSSRKVDEMQLLNQVKTQPTSAPHFFDSPVEYQGMNSLDRGGIWFTFLSGHVPQFSLWRGTAGASQVCQNPHQTINARQFLIMQKPTSL